MNTSTTTSTRAVVRPLIFVVALASLALAMAAIARPAFAADPFKVWLHEPHQDASSADFSEDEDCGDFTTGVVWHFILNQYDGNDTAHLVATFLGAGVLETDAQKVTPGVQHFYLNTPTDDQLDANNPAYAEVLTEDLDANLVLSHVCHTGNEETPTPTPSQSSEEETPTPTPTPTPSQSTEEETPTPTPTPSSEEETPTPTPTPSSEEETPTPTPTQSTEAETPTPTPEGSVQAGTGTPAPSIPDGAMEMRGGPSPIPTILFAMILLGSLGTLAWANVRTARNRS